MCVTGTTVTGLVGGGVCNMALLHLNSSVTVECLVLETDVLHASSEYSRLKSQAAESVKCRASGTMQKTRQLYCLQPAGGRRQAYMQLKHPYGEVRVDTDRHQTHL